MLQDEVFEILTGTMGYTLEGEELATTTGVSIPVGKRHTFWSADSSTELHYKVSLLYVYLNRSQRHNVLYSATGEFICCSVGIADASVCGCR